MKKDIMRAMPLTSSFLSIEQDTEIIFKKLFVENRPYSDDLKRLLIIGAKDCLDNKTNSVYNEKIKNTSVKDLINQGYLRLAPKLDFEEHEEIKSYIIVNFDNFTPNVKNPQYRDCTISFDVISHTDYWDVGNFRQRPMKMVGYIDGILNKARLSGIGTLNFAGCKELILSREFSGYTLMYRAIHEMEDKISKDMEDVE